MFIIKSTDPVVYPQTENEIYVGSNPRVYVKKEEALRFETLEQALEEKYDWEITEEID